jgi:anti-anti-sigma regulatory factor
VADLLESTIVLPVELDLDCVVEVRDQLERALGTPAIRIDGTQVQRVDTAGVQLLCAVVLAAERRGVPLAWTAVSPTLVTCVQRLGVGHVVRLDGVRQEGLEWFE